MLTVSVCHHAGIQKYLRMGPCSNRLVLSSRLRMRELRQLVSQNSTVEEIQAIGIVLACPRYPPPSPHLTHCFTIVPVLDVCTTKSH